jgi:hypothetical protein
LGNRLCLKTGAVVILAALILFVSLCISVAAPVSAEDAQVVAVNWLMTQNAPLGADLGGAVREVRAYSAEGKPLYYVVSLDPSGYVVVSANDLIEPIIAFSPDGSYEAVAENPLYELVASDLSAREAELGSASRAPLGESDEQTAYAKWSVLLSGRQPLGLSSINDPRVDPLTSSKWNQNNDRCCGNATYDYYTPPNAEGSSSNYPCGCVATAMAQLMRYWQYPTSGIGVHIFNIQVCGSSTTRSTRGGDGNGGAYNWASMDLDPCCPSTTTRQAIGALCADAGVSVYMNYCSGGSGTDTLLAAVALKNTFGYGQARRAYDNGSELPSEPRNRMINAGLHAGCPSILGISGTAGGHAVVCDGYGYNFSTMYHHLNLGWAGSSTAWYNLPNIDSNPSFTTLYKCVYNVFTTGSGEIIAGRVTDSSGTPISGATVTAGAFSDTTDSRGVYGLPKVASNTTYTVSVQKAGYTFAAQSVTTGTSSDNSSVCGNKWPIDFVALNAPSPPTNPGATNIATSSIRWTWTDNSSDETGFKVYADPGSGPPTTLQTTTGPNATYWDYTNLTANCQYCFKVAATNGSGDSAPTTSIARCTLAGPPSSGNNITCDRNPNVWYPAGSVFIFTNPAGFGTCGTYKASKFRYVWDTSPSHTWTGSEADWSSGSLALTPSATGTYYLHVQSCNADNAANSTTLDLGPYRVDTVPPSTPTVTDDGAAQTSTTALHAAFASTDASSGICEYQYAIGDQPSDPGSGYVVAWKSAGTSTQAAETGLALQQGSIYYWYVKARDCAGNWSSVRCSDGIAVVQSMSSSVHDAKLLPDGWSTGLALKPVSAVLDGAFYIQDADRPAGLRVVTDVMPSGLTAGRLVTVGGRLSTSGGGERYISASVLAGGGSDSVPPMGMNNRTLGGSDWNYGGGAGQRGIAGGIGLNNIGLLVRTWGKVMSTSPAEPVTIAFWSMDSNPGWTLQGSWAYGTPSGLGTHCLDPTSGYTGTRVVGYNLSGDYLSGMPSASYATTSAIDCSGYSSVLLRFYRRLGVESSNYDHATVQVSNDGTVWTTLWSNPTSDLCESAWTLQTYDISAVANGQRTVYVRWGIGPTDASVTYPGWNIDDVTILGVPDHAVTISDGSGAGILAFYPQSKQLPALNSYVSVTGISSCARDQNGSIRRLIRALP